MSVHVTNGLSTASASNIIYLTFFTAEALVLTRFCCFLLLPPSFPPLRLLVCAVFFFCLYCPMNKIKIPQSPAVPRAQQASTAPDSGQSFHGSSLPDFNVLTLLFHTGAPTDLGTAGGALALVRFWGFVKKRESLLMKN